MAAQGQYVEAGGRRLFVDVRGDPGAPALLYHPGGPGKSCYEFMQWQAAALSQELLLVGLDPRGVLRSDPLRDGEAVDEQRLVDDCESVREALGLGTWSVLGHSFGGRIALRYAHQHPDRVRSVIFECPAWDIVATEVFRLPRLAGLFDRLGRPDEARRCRELAARPSLFAEGHPAGIREALGALGGRWYLADPEAAARMAEADPPLPGELLERADAPSMQLLTHPEFLVSLLPLLPRLVMPALLIEGESDLVTSPDQAQAFRRDVPAGQVRVFADAGHFVQFEQAAGYASAVAGFVTGHPG